MKVIKFFRSHNEELVIVLAVLAFFLTPQLLRLIDPSAGVYDAGVLQIISVVIIAFSIFKSFTWFILSIIWPSIRSYFENHFVFDFNALTAWQKVRISIAIYFFLFLSLVLLFKVI